MNRWLLLVLSLMCFVDVSAHTPSESFSSWSWHNGALTVQFTVSEREASRITNASLTGTLSAELGTYLTRTVFPHERECSVREYSRSLPAQEGWLRIESRWQCTASPRTITARAFFDIAPEHTHYAAYKDADLVRHNVFTQERFEWQLEGDDVDANPSRRLIWFGISGFKHVVAGIDHLVFLLALLLTLRSGRDIVVAVTGFTLGHTLALAAIGLGNIAVKTAAIESLIGLSVCVVCIEYLFQREQKRAAGYGLLLGTIGLALILKLFLSAELSWGALFGVTLMFMCYLEFTRSTSQRTIWRLLVTMVFGLTHGAGFATGFTAAGASQTGLLPALISFNLGVELGQLAFIAGAMLVFRLFKLKRQGALFDAVIAVLFGIGVYWFLARGFSVATVYY